MVALTRYWALDSHKASFVGSKLPSPIYSMLQHVKSRFAKLSAQIIRVAPSNKTQKSMIVLDISQRTRACNKKSHAYSLRCAQAVISYIHYITSVSIDAWCTTHCWASASCDDNKMAQAITATITQYLKRSAISSPCNGIKVDAARYCYSSTKIVE